MPFRPNLPGPGPLFRVPIGEAEAAVADASVTPTEVIATAFIDTPSVTGNADITPTTVAAQAFVDTPTVTGDANITPTTVAATTAVDTPATVAIRMPELVMAPHRAA